MLLAFGWPSLQLQSTREARPCSINETLLHGVSHHERVVDSKWSRAVHAGGSHTTNESVHRVTCYSYELPVIRTEVSGQQRMNIEMVMHNDIRPK